MARLHIESGDVARKVELKGANDNERKHTEPIDAETLEKVRPEPAYEPSTAAKLRSSTTMSRGFEDVEEDSSVYEKSDSAYSLDPESPEVFAAEIEKISNELSVTEDWFATWSNEATFAALTKGTVSQALELRDKLSAARNAIAFYEQAATDELTLEKLEKIANQITQAYGEVFAQEEEFRAHFDERQHIETQPQYETKVEEDKKALIERREETEHVYGLAEKNENVEKAYRALIEELDRQTVVVESGRVLTPAHKRELEQRFDAFKAQTGDVVADQMPMMKEQAEQALSAEKPDEETVLTEPKTSPKNEVSTEREFGYADIREGWLEARTEHERLQKEYKAMVEAHYTAVQENTSLFGRLKATFGFKPKVTEEMSPEVLAKREEMFAATAAYNKFSRAMVQARELGGKEGYLTKTARGNEVVTAEQAEKLQAEAERKQKVMERYQRMLTRHTVVNALDSERAIQDQAAENLSIKPPKFLAKHPRATRYLGAAVLGAATAGGGSLLLGAGQAVVRAIGAGAVAGTAAKFINDRTERNIAGLAGRDNERNLAEGSDFERKIKEIGERLTPTSTNEKISESVSADELREMYEYLQGIYHQVDREQQKRIAQIIGAAIASGLVVGGGVEAFIDDSGAMTVESAVPGTAAADTAQNYDVNLNTGEGLSFSETTLSESAEGITHVAEPGFTVWDYFEGETNAPQPDIMKDIPVSEQQTFIKQIEIALDKDAALREEIGLGESSHDVQAGATLNLSALNELAESLRENAGDAGVEADTAPKEFEISETSEPFAVQASEIESQEASPVLSEVPTENAAEQESTETVQLNKETEDAANIEGAEAAVVSANEALQSEYGANPATVYEYELNYPGGPQEFLKLFNEDFVMEHQQYPKTGIAAMFGQNYSDAFAYMQGMRMEEIAAVQAGGDETVTPFLEESGIHSDDFASWVELIDRARTEEGEFFSDKDRFGETMKSYYIRTNDLSA